MSLGTHVTTHVNLIGKLWNINLEPRLNLVQNLLVGLTRNERDGNTLGSETTGTSHTVQELVRIIGEIIVDNNVHPLNINSTSE